MNIIMGNINKQNIIAQDIANKIKHEQYAIGEFLPSEHQLCELYGTSRETIRRALGQLNELGLIQKIKGKGSIVLDIQRYTFPISGITSFKELNESLGMHAVTTTLNQEKTFVPEKLARDLVAKNTPAIYVERLRKVNSEPVVVDQDYLLSPTVTELPEGVADNSIYAYLEGTLGLDISYATKEITVEKADQHIANCLQLKGDNLVVVVRSYSYLADTTLFQITASYHRPDKFRFIDFARRKKVITNNKK